MTKLFIFGDVHAPYHDRKAVELALKVARAWKPDGVVCMGDFFDFYALSFFDKDPSSRRWRCVADELAEARPLLAQFRALADDCDFICGNHEDRLKRYIQRRAPAMTGLVSLKDACGLHEWRIVNYGDFIRIGKVLYTHTVNPQYGGPYVAQRAIEAAGHSVVVGHAHRSAMIVAGDITAKHRVGVAVPWLGGVADADYEHKLKANREWSHGVVLGYMDEKGVTYFTPVPFVNGSCVVEGKVYSV